MRSPGKPKGDEKAGSALEPEADIGDVLEEGMGEGGDSAADEPSLFGPKPVEGEDLLNAVGFRKEEDKGKGKGGGEEKGEEGTGDTGVEAKIEVKEKPSGSTGKAIGDEDDLMALFDEARAADQESVGGFADLLKEIDIRDLLKDCQEVSSLLRSRFS